MRNIFLVLILICSLSKAQVVIYKRTCSLVAYKDSTGKWVIPKDSICTDSITMNPDWHSLKLDLYNSNTFIYILNSPSSANMVAYGALLSCLQDGEAGNGNASLLAVLIRALMQYSATQQAEVNLILKKNYFNIQI